MIILSWTKFYVFSNWQQNKQMTRKKIQKSSKLPREDYNSMLNDLVTFFSFNCTFRKFHLYIWHLLLMYHWNLCKSFIFWSIWFQYNLKFIWKKICLTSWVRNLNWQKISCYKKLAQESFNLFSLIQPISSFLTDLKNKFVVVFLLNLIWFMLWR